MEEWLARQFDAFKNPWGVDGAFVFAVDRRINKRRLKTLVDRMSHRSDQ
jgi:hypothetical protein